MSEAIWKQAERTGDDITDAFNDFTSWEYWMDEKCPGLLGELDVRQRADLYAVMCDLALYNPEPTEYGNATRPQA